MLLIHRVMLGRLLFNFMVLFGCLYLFATTIDLVLNLDEFSTIAREQVGEDAAWYTRLWHTVVVAADYEFPQLFHFYAFLHGLVAIAAVGFTCVQMARAREFVAIAAAGVSLRRLVWPVVGLVAILASAQVVNQEFILPRVGGLLLRNHGQAGQHAISAFRVPFTNDGHGVLLQAAAFEPDAESLLQPTFLHRDGQGRAIRRVWADSAIWDAQVGGWHLSNGVSASTDAQKEGVGVRQPETFEPSTLGPQRLIIRRRGEFAGMMSTPTLVGLVAEATRDDAAPLRRSLTARVAMPIVNLLCVLIAIPFFIDRLPGELLMRAVLCCAIVLPLYMFGAGAQVVALPGFGPIAGVLLPLVLLVPLAVWRIGTLRT